MRDSMDLGPGESRAGRVGRKGPRIRGDVDTSELQGGGFGGGGETTMPVVLVVEDSALQQRKYRTLLSGLYQVCFVKTGQDALLKMIEVRPDVVVLDWNLDDPAGRQHRKQMSGLDVLKAIKASAKRMTPVIMMTRAARVLR